ncbi:hypothetical protein ADUPG1_003812, partial [Aduncisulcus paluster]
MISNVLATRLGKVFRVSQLTNVEADVKRKLFYGYQTASVHANTNKTHELQPLGYISRADIARLPSTMRQFVSGNLSKLTTASTIEDCITRQTDETATEEEASVRTTGFSRSISTLGTPSA